MPKVYIHRAGPWYSLFMDSANEAAICSFADVVSEGDRKLPMSASELIQRLQGCDAILSLNGEGANEITADIVQSVASLRVVCIAHYWGWGHFTGVAERTKVSVVEGSNAGTLAVAEWNIAAALMGIRKLHLFDRALKAGSIWGEPRRNVGLFSGSTVGIVGLGRIGLYTARYFKTFSADVIAYSRSCSQQQADDLGIALVPLNELLSTADIVCLNHRVGEDTRGMLGAREFALLKPGSVFINAARAALYDEAVLIRALKAGRFTACLDVFAEEPLPRRHPFRFMENVVITPHIAGNNAAMFRRCARESIATLKDYFAGRGLVDSRYRFP
jgi:phosphoglycerate dehydrogenase-like enzyme